MQICSSTMATGQWLLHMRYMAFLPPPMLANLCHMQQPQFHGIQQRSSRWHDGSSHCLDVTVYKLCDLICRFEAVSTQQAEVDATSEYAAVIRLRLDKLRIVLAAEIDCCDPSKVKSGHRPDLASYLELKTYL